MPIDPTSTKPGVTPTQEAPAKLNMRCKMPNCDSIQAIELKSPGPGVRMYQCCKCSATRCINVGGAINL